MVKEKINPKAKTIEVEASTNKEFFLIHGYTGSVTDFVDFVPYLNKEFNTNVKVIRLPGHGTKVEDLEPLEYEDLLRGVEKELKKDLDKGREIVIGGISFGAQLALILADKYPVKGVFTIGVPYRYKYRLGVFLYNYIGRIRKYWKKPLHPDEVLDKSTSFYYTMMPFKGLKVVRDASKEIEKILPNLNVPYLSLFSKGENLCDWRGSRDLLSKIPSKVKKGVYLDCKVHNSLHSPQKTIAYKEICDFFKKHKIFTGDKEREIKKVLFLYENIGHGHKNISESVKNYLMVKNPEMQTLSASPVEENHPLIFSSIKNIYVIILKYFPWLWNFLHQGKSVLPVNTFFTNLSYNYTKEGFRKIIDEFQPDVVFCTHAFSGGAASALKEENDFNLVASSADMFFHNYWTHKNIEKFYVANSETKKDLQLKNIDKTRINITGIPIDKKFFKKNNNTHIRKKLGFDRDKPIILITGGGWGFGNLKKSLSVLESLEGDFQIAIVTGRNKKLFDKLNKENFSKKVKVFGFIENIEELMEISDFIIGKPGGMITAEAIAKRLPMVVYGSLPGQEQRNLDFLLKSDVCCVAKNKNDLKNIVPMLLKDKSKLLSMQARIEQINMDNALANVAEKIKK